MAISVYGDITPRTAAFAVAKMLVRAQPYLVLEKFMQMFPIPNNSTKVAKFRRYEALALATTPLTEGVTPAGKTMSYTDVTATLAQYGDFVVITDVIKDTHEDPIFMEYQDIIAEQAAQTIEAVRFGIFKAGTNVFYMNGSARTDVNTAFTSTTGLAKQRAVTRAFKRQNAAPISKITSTSPNYGTQPITASYMGLCHPDLETDIRGLTGFVPVENYVPGAAISEFEIGKVENVRYIVSTVFSSWADAGGAKGTMVSTTGTSADVYPILFLAKDSIAGVPLKGKDSLTPVVHNPTISDSDKLGQRGHVGWKTMQTAVILNEVFLARLETAATDLS